MGSKAAVTKLTQLRNYHVYNPIYADSLTPAKRKMALESLMNIIEKHNGQVCASTDADGSKERHQSGYKKEDSASPTVATDSIMVIAAINTHERRVIATVNVPGTFMKAYNNKDTFMLLCGRLAELMVQVNPALYRKYVIYGKNNEALLYIKLAKAIYGLLKSALLFYKEICQQPQEL